MTTPAPDSTRTPGGGIEARTRGRSTVGPRGRWVRIVRGLALLSTGLLAGAFGGWRAARLRPAAALTRVE